MKNLIYISILAFLLGACKSNSFMRQHYTNFAHNNYKNTIKEKLSSKTEPVIDRETVTLQKIETSKVLASAIMGITKEDIIISSPVTIQFNNINTNVSKKETETLEHSNTIVKEKKLNQQKHQVAKRIIGTLLKIVLWLIILAVVVGILLIMGVLA